MRRTLPATDGDTVSTAELIARLNAERGADDDRPTGRHGMRTGSMPVQRAGSAPQARPVATVPRPRRSPVEPDASFTDTSFTTDPGLAAGLRPDPDPLLDTTPLAFAAPLVAAPAEQLPDPTHHRAPAPRPDSRSMPADEPLVEAAPRASRRRSARPVGIDEQAGRTGITAMAPRADPSRLRRFAPLIVAAAVMAVATAVAVGTHPGSGPTPVTPATSEDAGSGAPTGAVVPPPVNGPAAPQDLSTSAY